MESTLTRIAFIGTLLVAGAYVYVTSQALPDRVASHFGASGLADSFMSRSGYVSFMLCFVVALPLVMAVSMAGIFRRAGMSMNIPNRDYWLADERRDATVAFLVNHAMRLAIGLTVFLCFVHKLVVDANTRTPPALDNPSIYIGLVVFLLGVALWVASLWFAFRRPTGQ